MSVVRGISLWDFEPAGPIQRNLDLVRLDWPTARLPARTTRTPSEARRSTAARPPSANLTGTSARSETDLLIGRRGGTNDLLGRAVRRAVPGLATSLGLTLQRCLAQPGCCSLNLKSCLPPLGPSSIERVRFSDGIILPRPPCALLTGEAIERFGRNQTNQSYRALKASSFLMTIHPERLAPNRVA